MITIKEMTTYIRLLDLYKLEKIHNILRSVKSYSINNWYTMGNGLIEKYVDDGIKKQIQKAKQKINMSNKKSYLLSYKLWKKNT